jgi:hypothetical protein
MSVDYGKQFGQIFWLRVCQRYRDLIIDTTATEFAFDFADVRRPFEEGGLGIEGFDQPFIEKMLFEIQDEGLIVINLDRRQFLLTEAGIKRCNS